jgi:hypothetical protein
MGTSNGSGWVEFTTIHPRVTECIKEYCAKNARNDILELPSGVLIWHRDPDESGRGVAENNQIGDFERMIAAAVLRFPISTVTHPEHRAWNWNFRPFVRDLVRISDSGWDPRPEAAAANA